MDNELKIQIFSDSGYNYLVAEIYCDDIFVALISQEQGPDKLMIEFPETVNALKKVGFDWFINALQKAKKELL